MPAVPRPLKNWPPESRRPGDAATIATLRAELEAQAQFIREQSAALAHSRKIFDRASATARIGVWECELADEGLTWTDQVYDLFELPRGAPLDRQNLLTFYTPESLHQLHERRSRAIAERGGFHLDAEIITAKGRHRWIRITATVECENGLPVRIFGMKQDVTEEKLLSDRMRYLAEFDIMTGLANRGSFQMRLDALAEGAEAPFGALLLVDLDGFKQINDLFGHALGDECLKEAAIRLKSICGEGDFVARIGGDEFAVLLSATCAQTDIDTTAERIVEAISQPIRYADRSFQIGASVGVACVGTRQASELFTQADAALYAAKASGRNTYRLFSPALLSTVPARPAPPADVASLDRRRFRSARVS
ncbi:MULTISPECIES: diguanylate cyclase [unclassified Beijerinckia]|uniref:diguanylate cyclase domain-containing protein n=1 Tax=unclassified Beijerinckia TaxID=2638183 RepID=UPI000894B732|nr:MULTISPECIES: diguanylate cyclase [unclassified Beijerinckia]MDH7798565.1 diguanylate cyclase (GGDEF)-like protein [Beijerinckia sp. GAS462]SED25106.1 diguanylate cyclase (GGDEF) domain-containing protein [Beijerinckia sp. 28-YEA-48]